MSRVLFICVGNQGRSLMAERLFNQLAAGRHTATSAGSRPGKEPHAGVLEALREIGIEAGDHVPRKIDMDEVAAVDAVVSTCGEEECPVTPPGTKRIYWNITDPIGLPVEEVRPIRDDIRRRVEKLLLEL